MEANKRQMLLDYCLGNGNVITASQAFSVIGHTYYHNGKKWTGEVLSRMVKAGLLERTKRGEYKLGSGKKAKAASVPKNQGSLFD